MSSVFNRQNDIVCYTLYKYLGSLEVTTKRGDQDRSFVLSRGSETVEDKAADLLHGSID